MGIYVLPMPFYINEELFYEDITLTQEEFYEKLAGDADIKDFPTGSRRCNGYVGQGAGGI